MLIVIEKLRAERREPIGKDRLPHSTRELLQVPKVMQRQQSQTENLVGSDQMPDI